MPLALLSETGTGKELLARAIHQHSASARGPFVALNCAALPSGLIESELFGYAPGAFSGASASGCDGWLATADQGTLFLDEVGELPSEVQSALLRFLEDGAYARVGERRLRHARVRLVVATSRDLHDLVKRGKVRKDFYYRVCAASITLPALRERTDRLALAESILDRQTLTARRSPLRLAYCARVLIHQAAWPGNIRQLKHALQVAAALCDTDEILGAHFPEIDFDPPQPVSREMQPATLTVGDVRNALGKTRGNVAAAARTLGVARSTIYRLARRHGLSLAQLSQPSAEDPLDGSSR